MIRYLFILFLTIFGLKILSDLKKSFSKSKNIKGSKIKKNDLDRSKIEDARFTEIDDDSN